MAEWLKAAVLKTVSRRRDVGSNPTPSARAITYHPWNGWFDEDPSKGSKSIAIHADYNPISRTQPSS